MIKVLNRCVYIVNMSGTMTDMLYRFIGTTGIKVSIFGCGTWLNCNEHRHFQEISDIFNTAHRLGINMFDTAEVYGSGKTEILFGEILKTLKWPRQDYLLSGKVFWGGSCPTANGLNKKHLRDACDKTLKRLGVNYIDFFICHRPDYDTPLIETIDGMNNLIRQGKILYWGTSEWPIELVKEVQYISKQNQLIGPSVEQMEYNMFARANVESNGITFLEKLGIGLIATMPLAGGILTNKYSESFAEGSRGGSNGQQKYREFLYTAEGQRQINLARQLNLVASNIGITSTQLSLAWTLRHNLINSVLLGASSKCQLIENIKSIEYISLITPEVNQQIDGIIGNLMQAQKSTNPTYDEVVSYG